jgi:hypothetical protein
VAGMFPPGWLPHTVTRKRRAGAPDANGDPTFGASASVAAVGYIDVTASFGLEIPHGALLTLTDNKSTPETVTFEFIIDGGAPATAGPYIALNGIDATATIVGKIANAILGHATLSITAAAASPRITLTQDVAGAGGNTDIVTGNGTVLTITDFAGGVSDARETFSARVEKTDKTVKRPDGTDVQAKAVFATNTECAYTDIFWLPAIGGEPADDTTKDAAARRPASIKYAGDKSNRRQGWEVYFE